MNAELLEIATKQYQREYDEWLKSEPKKEDFIETVTRLIKHLKNINKE